jgi:D-beta-D-heptose 7-phosphate kinase/D-beta-D-heptose 1-phosphate adenosyltransferase
VHCVGDAMIDEYYKVKVSRISPEAPVPVMVCQNDFVQRPGGSANVAYQFKHLNAYTKLVCFNDPKANEVFDQHCLSRICSEDILATLPVKRRYLENGIQVAPRHDFEKHLCGLTIEQISLLMQYLGYQVEKNKPDVAILSDYNKGFFADRNKNILDYYWDVITIVDPKTGPLDQWKGCTIFKPNAKEAFDLSGLKNWQEQARYFQHILECKAVVITFGGERVAGIWKNELFEYIPSKQVAVESVIGAGDCFAAFFAAATGHGFNPIESAEIAWNAGSVYVQQRMNRPVVPAELVEDKIVQPEDLRNRDFKLVFTNGCFDILHKGHLQTLKFAKSKGEKLVVALNSDQSIKTFKNSSRPVVPLEHRMAIMANLDVVDFVVSFDEETPLTTIEKIRPDVLVKGGDYTMENIVGATIVPEVFQAPILPDASTTKFITDWTQRG